MHRQRFNSRTNLAETQVVSLSGSLSLVGFGGAGGILRFCVAKRGPQRADLRMLDRTLRRLGSVPARRLCAKNNEPPRRIGMTAARDRMLLPVLMERGGGYAALGATALVWGKQIIHVARVT